MEFDGVRQGYETSYIATSELFDVQKVGLGKLGQELHPSKRQSNGKKVRNEF